METGATHLMGRTMVEGTDFPHSYDSDYFLGREMTDPRRLESFRRESELIRKFAVSGAICDVGCGTGEFHGILQWPGKVYGMEISDVARISAIGRGIDFSKDISNTENFFDVVIFRGVIQHLPQPFEYLNYAFRSLKPGGYVVFLMTPNADSIVYRLFGHLPMLDPKRNFWIPSRTTLTSNLENLGMNIVHTSIPYWRSPYRRLINDHFRFFLRLLACGRLNFAFWGNVFEIIAQKPASRVE